MLLSAAVAVCIDFDGVGGATFKTGVFVLHQVPRILAVLAKHAGVTDSLADLLAQAIQTATAKGPPSFIELLTRGLVWYELLPAARAPISTTTVHKVDIVPRQPDITPTAAVTIADLDKWRPKQPADLIAVQHLVPHLVNQPDFERVVSVIVKSGQERAELMPEVLQWLMNLIDQGTADQTPVQPWLVTLCGATAWSSHSFKGLARAAHTLGVLGKFGATLERLCVLLGQLLGSAAHRAFGAMLMGVLVVGSEQHGRVLFSPAATGNTAGAAELTQWGLDLTRHCFVERAEQESAREGSKSNVDSTNLSQLLFHKNEQGVMAMTNTVTPVQMLTGVVPQLMLLLRKDMQVAHQRG